MAAHINGRRLVGGLLGIVVSSLVLVPAPPATAAKPVIERFPGGSATILHGECAFPVREDSVSRQGISQTFFDRNGEPRTVHVAGAFNGTLTRVLPDGTDGTSLRINFSGPGNFDPAAHLLRSRPVAAREPGRPRHSGVRRLPAAGPRSGVREHRPRDGRADHPQRDGQRHRPLRGAGLSARARLVGSRE